MNGNSQPWCWLPNWVMKHLLSYYENKTTLTEAKSEPSHIRRHLLALKAIVASQQPLVLLMCTELKCSEWYDSHHGGRVSSPQTEEAIFPVGMVYQLVCLLWFNTNIQLVLILSCHWQQQQCNKTKLISVVKINNGSMLLRTNSPLQRIGLRTLYKNTQRIFTYKMVHQSITVFSCINPKLTYTMNIISYKKLFM